MKYKPAHAGRNMSSLCSIDLCLWNQCRKLEVDSHLWSSHLHSPRSKFATFSPLIEACPLSNPSRGNWLIRYDLEHPQRSVWIFGKTSLHPDRFANQLEILQTLGTSIPQKRSLRWNKYFETDINMFATIIIDKLSVYTSLTISVRNIEQTTGNTFSKKVFS